MPRTRPRRRAISRNACRVRNTGTCRSKVRPKRRRSRESWNSWRRHNARTHCDSHASADLPARRWLGGLSRVAVDGEKEIYTGMVVRGTADGQSAEGRPDVGVKQGEENESSVEGVRRCSLICSDGIDFGGRSRENGSYTGRPE